MLDSGTVTANIPASDLNRARAFYADKLGLEPVADFAAAGMLIYRTGGGSTFTIYQTEYAGQAGHTIAQFHVDDVEKDVRELAGRGVSFEHYDMPGVLWQGDVAVADGMGKAAWFKDSEQNILCIDEGMPEG